MLNAGNNSNNFVYKTYKKYQPIIIFLLITFFIISAVFFVHKGALNSEAITFDDGEYLIHNKLVNNPSFRSVKIFLSEVTRPSTVSGYYQPLSMISLMMDVYLGGSELNLSQFHLTSLILHLANSILVGIIIYIS